MKCFKLGYFHPDSMGARLQALLYAIAAVTLLVRLGVL